MISADTEAVREVEGLWKLPDGWQWISLEKLCSHFYGGGTPKRSRTEYFGSDIVWVTPTDLDANAPCQEIYTSQTKITPLGLKSSSAQLVPVGTVLFSTRATIGKIAIAGVPLCTNQGFANLVCNNYLNNRYLAWCLRTLTEEIKKLASSTTYLEVSRGNLRRFKIPIPFPELTAKSLEIQNRIVTRIESLLAELKGDRQLLDEMRRDTKGFMIITLEKTFKYLNSTRQPLINVIESKPRNGWSPQCDDNPNGNPVLKLGAVLRFRYNPDEIKRTSLPIDPNAHYWLQPGDILISRSNTIELVGHAAIYSGTPFPCIYPDLMMRMRVNELKADSRFLIYWLQTKEVRQFIQSRASGASPTMKKINQSDVCNIPFPTISLEEQRQFANHLNFIQSEIDEMQQTIGQDEQLLSQLEQSILEKAFQGQL